MKTIIINKGKDCWMADFCDDADVLIAFGTTNIPTPFGLTMPELEVMRRMRELNPGYKVFMGDL